MSCIGYAESVAGIVSRDASRCNCIMLSGGVDTSFIALVHPRRGQLTAITVDMGGSDAVFASRLALRLGINSHVIVKPSLGEVFEAVDWVLANFKTIDPVEVSADIVHYISISKAKALGCDCMLSGDGGDELFAGYTFLYNMDPESVRGWIRERALHSRLPTVEVGSRLGVEVTAPLYTWELRMLAPEIPVECLVSSGQGKLLLREYLKAMGFEDIALRPKTPVNEGSGSLRLLEGFSAKINPQDYELVAGKLGFKPPSKLHAWLALRLLSLNVEPPPTDPASPCPICGRQLTGGYCRFCGAYVSPGGIISHYGGFKP